MRNHHATALVVGERGIMIEGASGGGKTQLALRMIGHMASQGIFSRLVADDQVLLAVRSEQLVAYAPKPTEGLAEARGLGPSPIAFVPRAVIDVVVCLVDSGKARRFRDDAMVIREGVTLPSLDLAEGQADAGVHALAAYLNLPPFSGRNATS